MLWKILLLAACALAAWGMTRPRGDAAGDDGKARRLALCPKCGVYHSPDSPCGGDSDSGADSGADSGKSPNNSGPRRSASS